MTDSIFTASSISRRSVLRGAATLTTLLAAPAVLRAQSGGKIKLGAPFHRTGIGASYGRWYERTATAALKLINEGGG
ncbi:MAG: ABC transporter substrate-binding protein, partial [Rhizobiaceae bacterium]